MEEKRKLTRIDYSAKAVIVVCDTEEKIFVEVKNVSPLGMGIKMIEDKPYLLGKDVIIVADTIIMYANVNRIEKNEEGGFDIGIRAKRFTEKVLKYLFDHIGQESELQK